MSFYIGLSFLSNNNESTRAPKKGVRQELLSAEARRILSCLENRPIGENDFARDENGRPYLPGTSGDFNISHSGAAAAVSLVSGAERRTGCDIQIVRPRPNMGKIADRFFTLPEREYIFADGNTQSAESRFFEIWTLKECFLKLRGLSVFDMASVPSFISRDGQGQFVFDAAVSSPLLFYLYELTGSGERYFLAAAIEGIDPEVEPYGSAPVIRWFSQSFLPCRSIAEIKAALSPAKTVNPNM